VNNTAAGFSYAGFFCVLEIKSFLLKALDEKEKTWRILDGAYRRNIGELQQKKVQNSCSRTDFFSEEICKKTISKYHTSVKLSGKFSSTPSTSTVKKIAYFIVDLHNKNCLIERIALLKMIFLRCWSELISRDRMELIPSKFFSRGRNWMGFIFPGKQMLF